MKSIQAVFLFIGALVFLNSCSTEPHFSKRKYLPGFFREHSGKKEISSNPAEKSESKALQNDSAEKIKTKENQTNPVQKENSETEIPLIKNSGSNSVPEELTKQEENQPQESIVKSDEPPQSFQEKKKINLALILALSAILLFALGTLIIFSSGVIIASAIFWALALTAGLFGYFIGKKIRRAHLPGEKYKGKLKVDFAVLIGYFAWVLGSIGVAIGLILLGFMFFY